MKKADLKKVIKPLVKECIHEVLIEEGFLSQIVTEVATGISTAGVITESAPQPVAPKETPQPRRNNAAAAKTRKKLMDAIGNDAYNGVNLFEGTTPLSSYESSEPKAGAVDLGDPGDSGVDISSLMGGASRMWEAMK